MVSRTALSQNYVTRAAVTAEAWSSLSGWGAEGGGAAIALETTTTPPYGGAAVKLSQSTAGGTGQATKYTLTAMNFVDPQTMIICPVYFPTDHIGGSATIQIGSGGVLTANYSKSISSSKTLYGWNLYAFSLSEMTKTGSPDITAINTIRIKCLSPSGVTTYGIFGPIKYYARARTKVGILFDDGLKTVYDNAKPLMDARSIPGTMFLGIGSANGSTTLSTAQIQEMYAAGWDIGSHLYDQAPILTSGYTTAQQLAQISSNISALDAIGCTRSSRILGWPGGEVDDTVIAMAVASGNVMGFTTQFDPLNTVGGGIYQVQHLPRWSFDSGSNSVATVLAEVDKAILSGRSIFLYSHSVVTSVTLATEISIANFTTLLDTLVTYRNKGWIDFTTPSTWRQGLSQPRA
jgi:hypothetical protein